MQGVGFRPTVHRIATSMGLVGWIINDPQGATAEIEGDESTVGIFPERLAAALPPLARIDHVAMTEVVVEHATLFEVRESTRGRRAGALVPPDASLCGDCRREMDDPDDRRHRYSFTTCTNCGPRFSIVRRLPYDRPETAMACFPLCDACLAEYTDPSNRRFHAEPVCCPSCGPRLSLLDAAGEILASDADAVDGARRTLLAGDVLAVKGIGGFQLACRADQLTPVATLRARKRRPTKPFAVMVRDPAEADGLVHLTDADHQLLVSHRAPVVLAPRRRPNPLADAVAPGIDDLGVLVTTTPLHVELFADPEMPPLVMTSANLSEEPICRSNREALERLGNLADVFLVHDRDVVRRVDDSVVRSTRDGPVVLRRARGWVPDPLPLPEPTPEPLLAVGGHLQITACLADKDQAFLSQHVGDLDSEPARLFHREVIAGLEDFLQVEPTTIVADAHPDYPSSWMAAELVRERGGRMVTVQHHLAHAAAVLAEFGRFPDHNGEVLAISLDGTGWGPDGTAWGGEWIRLRGDLSWDRAGHLQPLPLVGGERAVREPWRVAVAALVGAEVDDALEGLPVFPNVGRDHVREVARLARSGTWPMASGAGRLFEAAGALIGEITCNDWEGEAAVHLESLAAQWPAEAATWKMDLDLDASTPRLPSRRLLAEAARRLAAGDPPPHVAASFHQTFCRLAVDLTREVGAGIGVVAVGGGCMANRLLRGGLAGGLASGRFRTARGHGGAARRRRPVVRPGRSRRRCCSPGCGGDCIPRRRAVRYHRAPRIPPIPGHRRACRCVLPSRCF